MNLAEEVRSLIDTTMAESDRSKYSRSALGVSDVGHCHEYARRVILNHPPEQPQNSYMAAFIGTAVGDHLERTYQQAYPQTLIQHTVTVRLLVENYELRLPGHPDIIDPVNNRVLDWKTKNGLGKIAPTQQEYFQVSLYAKAAIEDGWLTNHCTCALVYIDRSGDDPDPVVYEWTYDPKIVEQAEEWLHDVVYALINEEEASKDKPRSWCWACCPFAPSCRGEDTDVEGFIEDDGILLAVNNLIEARENLRKWERVRKSASTELKDVVGSTGKYNIRWVNIPGGHVEFDRSSYWKLDVTPVRGIDA